jgi:hypothetical protein
MGAKRVYDQAFYDRAELLARAHPLQDVAAILGIQPSQVTRMKQRGWKLAPPGRKRRPIPSDFSIQAGLMTFAELVAHYRTGNQTVLRWMREGKDVRPSWKGRNLERASKSTKRGGEVSPAELRRRRLKQWEERRRKYGPSGRKPRDIVPTPETTTNA